MLLRLTMVNPLGCACAVLLHPRASASTTRNITRHTGSLYVVQQLFILTRHSSKQEPLYLASVELVVPLQSCSSKPRLKLRVFDVSLSSFDDACQWVSDSDLRVQLQIRFKRQPPFSSAPPAHGLYLGSERSESTLGISMSAAVTRIWIRGILNTI
ncbi:hypothetical protein C8R44DRAFT_733435 [Mycena epipterygia]|nr:hypothetical protein C8R44DRAFT_733435 [Mycena epipterygia]